jgi:hypothetical protein
VAGPLKNGEVVASWRNTSRNSFSSGVRIVIFTAPVALLSRSRPLVGPLGESSSSHTDRLVQMLKYTRVTFHRRTLLLTEPTPPPCPRTASPRGLQAAPARSFLVEIRRAAHIKGSPLPPALYKALVLQSCTTRRANPLLSAGSSGILRLEASPGSPWPLGHVMPPFYTITRSTQRSACSTAAQATRTANRMQHLVSHRLGRGGRGSKDMARNSPDFALSVPIRRLR